MILAKIASASLALFLGCVGLAQGQQSCPQRAENGEQITACLQKEWGEEVWAIGINERGSLVRTFVNDATRTWTITTTLPSGQGCINSHGGHFEIIMAPPS